MSVEFRYVSCVPGKLVARFGTGTHIGATVDLKTCEASFDPLEVVAIPLAEWTAYVREYNRLVRAGDLLPRTAEEHKRWQAEQAKASNDAAQQSVAAAKAEEAKALAAQVEADGKAEQERKSAIDKAKADKAKE